MDKFERHTRTQASRVRKRRVKLGRRRTTDVTATKKSKVRVGLNERVLELEAENRSLRAEIKEIRLSKSGGRK